MLLFFYGPNDYLIHRQVKKIKDRYKEKAGGDLNLTTLDGETLTYEDFARQTEAMPLLATSRLVIISDIFKNKNKKLLDQIKENLAKIPPSTVLIFTQSGEPDKRLGLFKALIKDKNTKYFKNIAPEKLSVFITKEVSEKGGEIEPPAARLLSEYVGDDLWRQSTEIDKLLAFSNNKITSRDVESQIIKSSQGNVFSLIDDLARGQKNLAFKELDALISLGEPPLRILSLVNYQYRLIAQVKDALERSSNSFSVAKEARLSPFQVTKTLSIARKISWFELAKIYKKMVEIDGAIKTGKMNDSEGLRELVIYI